VKLGDNDEEIYRVDLEALLYKIGMTKSEATLTWRNHHHLLEFHGRVGVKDIYQDIIR
jgi:hypothetical protein